MAIKTPIIVKNDPRKKKSSIDPLIGEDPIGKPDPEMSKIYDAIDGIRKLNLVYDYGKYNVMILRNQYKEIISEYDNIIAKLTFVGLKKEWLEIMLSLYSFEIEKGVEILETLEMIIALQDIPTIYSPS